jgi:hypothetical protein
MADCGLNTNRTILLAVGPQGLELAVPESVTLLPLAHTVESCAPASRDTQRALIKAALDAPTGALPLRQLAKDHRRVAILAGDLSLPAPYDTALPPLLAELVAAGIRPTRISVLACPGVSGPLLGRAAIRRYGEDVAGEYAVTNLTGGASDAAYAAADLRIAVAPALPGPFLPGGAAVDLWLELSLGRKTVAEIAAARCGAQRPGGTPPSPAPLDASADVLLTTGGGAYWETTLEETLLSLAGLTARAPRRPTPATAVLAFSGHYGLGSARFFGDLRGLLSQAEEVLAGGEPLTVPPSETGCFDPAGSVAEALSCFGRVVLFSRALAEHDEGDELAEQLAALPALAGRLFLCAEPNDLWERLVGWHGPNLRLAAEPLGWRAACGA